MAFRLESPISAPSMSGRMTPPIGPRWASSAIRPSPPTSPRRPTSPPTATAVATEGTRPSTAWLHRIVVNQGLAALRRRAAPTGA